MNTMSWLAILWAVCAAASGMLAAMHLLLWFHDRRKRFYLWSSLACFGAASTAGSELALMKAASIAAADQAILWQVPAIALLFVSLTWFLFTWFGTGRRWLAISIMLLWGIVIADNFLLPGNQVFSEITGLEPHETPWGELYMIPNGSLNPLKWLGDIPSILFLVFVVDASVRLCRRGNPRRAWAVGGVIVFFTLLAGVHTPLVDTGLVKTPYLIGFFFLAIVVLLTKELVRDIAQASRTADELRRVRSELEHLGRVNLLGELSAALAHELNQPLAAILANAEAGSLFLNDAEPDLDEIADILRDIAGQDKRAREVIRRLRSMLEKGASARESIDLNHEVEEAVALLTHELKINAVTLDLDLGRHLPPVRADRLGIQQVIVNLMLNAEQAAAAGRDSEGKVFVQTRVAGDSATVEVSDNGPGIDPAKLAMIFEPFYTTKPSGIGMGLSICRTIIENLGGKIRAENKNGGGAAFTFSIPLENGESAE